MKTKFNLQTVLMCLGFAASAAIIIGVSSCGKDKWGKHKKHEQKDTLVHTDTTKNGGGGTDSTNGGGNQDTCSSATQEKISSVGVNNGYQFNSNDSACFNVSVVAKNSCAQYAYIEEVSSQPDSNNVIHVYLIAKVYYKGCNCTTGNKTLNTTYCLTKRNYSTQYLHFQQPDGTYIDRTVYY